MKFVDVAVDFFLVAITKVMGCGMLVKVGAPVTLFPKSVKGATEFIIFFLFTHMDWLDKLDVVTKWVGNEVGNISTIIPGDLGD